MEIIDSGVLEDSFMDFTVPSQFATEVLYYVPQFGHFFCDRKYYVARDSLDLYLMVFIAQGSLEFRMNGKEFTGQKGEIVLLDCHVPHSYRCREQSEFYWFHFGGKSSEGYVRFLYQQNSPVFSGEYIQPLFRHFGRIFHYAQEVPSNEPLISAHVEDILGHLASPGSRTAVNRSLEPALDCIRRHYQEDITVEDMAFLCSMSRSHFMRMFSRSFNRTPHDYLLEYRLRMAKQLLYSTSDSMDSIAEQCGFNSASHFSRAFRSSNGISPGEFRKMQF